MRHPVVKALVRIVQCAIAVGGALLLWLVVMKAVATRSDPVLIALQPVVIFSLPAVVTFVIASFIRSPGWLRAFALVAVLSPAVFLQWYFAQHTPVPEGSEDDDFGVGIVFIFLVSLAAGAVLGAAAKGVALALERAGQSTTTAMTAQTAVVLAVLLLIIVPRLWAVRPLQSSQNDVTPAPCRTATMLRELEAGRAKQT